MTLHSAPVALTVEQSLDLASPEAPEWQARDGLTFCNWFTRKVCKLMGAYMVEAVANAMADWLASPAAVDAGWVMASEQVARQWCDAGGLALAIWKNPHPRRRTDGGYVKDAAGNVEYGHGHVAVLTVAPSGKTGTWVANVGKTNRRRMELVRAFGNRALAFYTWHPKRASEVPQA